MHTKMRVVPTLPASDVERARRFYEDTLGFKLEGQAPDGSYLFQAGDGYFAVYETSAPRGGNTALSFSSDNFDSEVEEFRKRGVKFEEYPDMPDTSWENGVATYHGGRGFWFTDSEGNILAVMDGMFWEKELRRAA